MEARTEIRLLRALAGLLWAAAAAAAVFAAVLVRDGAFPPPGTGSLGHVGMTIGGIIAAFAALILGGLGLVCLSRCRTLRQADRARSDGRP